MGPPKEVRPSFRKTRKTSPGEPAAGFMPNVASLTSAVSFWLIGSPSRFAVRFMGSPVLCEAYHIQARTGRVPSRHWDFTHTHTHRDYHHGYRLRKRRRERDWFLDRRHLRRRPDLWPR